MRRRPGALVSLEASILTAGLELEEFHGYSLAGAIRARANARQLTAHGTLYKALGRMESAGLLASRWESAAGAAAESRPRRRLYRVTGAGAQALARWERQLASPASPAVRPIPGLGGTA